MFKNVVLRKIFGPKREEVIRGWTKVHNEGLRDLYSLPNIIWVIKSRRMRLVGHVAYVEEGIVFSGNRKESRPLSRPRHRQENNIKIDLKEWD
jgi:hypothetical protein